MNCVLEDSQQGTKSEDLVPFLEKAYAETLKAYHGWVARKLFTVSNYIIISVSYHRFIKEDDKMLILVKYFMCGCYRFIKHLYSLLVSSQVMLTPLSRCTGLVQGSTDFYKMWELLPYEM